MIGKKVRRVFQGLETGTAVFSKAWKNSPLTFPTLDNAPRMGGETSCWAWRHPTGKPHGVLECWSTGVRSLPFDTRATGAPATRAPLLFLWAGAPAPASVCGWRGVGGAGAGAPAHKTLLLWVGPVSPVKSRVRADCWQHSKAPPLQHSLRPLQSHGCSLRSAPPLILGALSKLGKPACFRFQCLENSLPSHRSSFQLWPCVFAKDFA